MNPFKSLYEFIKKIWNRIFHPKKITIKNPLEYLVQTNDKGEFVKSTDLLTSRRHDWPLPLGWQVSDSVLLPDGKVLQTFSFAPWKEFNLANGDGGQTAVIDDEYVKFISTRDGGTPWTQYFVGGTGWIVFGTDAVSGSWKEVVASLRKQQDPNAKPKGLDLAYTRYRIENINFQFALNGIITNKTLTTVVSEHYDGSTIETSHNMERSYFAKGFGLLRWEAWGTGLAPISLKGRYFPVDYSTPPGPWWIVHDVRTWTNIVDINPGVLPPKY